MTDEEIARKDNWCRFVFGYFAAGLWLQDSIERSPYFRPATMKEAIEWADERDIPVPAFARDFVERSYAEMEAQEARYIATHPQAAKK